MKIYRQLFFDLDHTLWDFEENAKETLQQLFMAYQLASHTHADFKDFHQTYLFHNASLWTAYENGKISVEDLKWKRMWRTLLHFKIANEALAKELSVQFLELLPTKKLLFPETIETLDYLKQKNYQLHLITNGFKKTQELKIKNSGIAHYFTEVITSECSNSMKPKKEIFEYALQKSKATLNESIMLGDNLNADIKGALDIGMDCVYVNHVKSNLTHNATYQITHLNQIKNIL